MPRKVKINALPVALAWLIIFLHGAIPHNHQQEDDNGCKSVFHCSHDTIYGYNDESIGESGHAGQHHLICHYNSGPFHSLDNVILFFTAYQAKSFDDGLDNAGRLCLDNATYISRLIFLPDNLRAPPSFRG